MRLRRQTTRFERGREFLVVAVMVLCCGWLGCRRPQRSTAGVEVYLDGLEVADVRAVRMCWMNCEEAAPIGPGEWGGLLAALEKMRPRSEPVSAFGGWRWICRITLETSSGGFLDVAVQSAFLGVERGTFATVAGGGGGEDYNIFDGEPVAAWCREASSP